ncbi:MAG: carboxylating nicotinate-nucleotide diphosphorylase [Myxococcota bacterium]
MKTKFIPHPHVISLINLALAEDLNGGDPTSALLSESNFPQTATIYAKSNFTVAGLPLLPLIIQESRFELEVEFLAQEGDQIKHDQHLARIRGKVLEILILERTLLNFLQQLSAVATSTRKIKDLVDDKVKVADTRKTIPGWRYLQKYAVLVGGGSNHRFNLAGGIMIKDNHIDACGGIAQAVEAMRQHSPHSLRIEVETRNLEEVKQALAAKADIIMLDNMSPELMKSIIDKYGQQAIFEASGNITRDNIQQIAHCGVQVISLGSLTHTINPPDISMKIDPTP